MKLVATRQLAISIMTGVVSESFLVTSGMGGQCANLWMLHKITIAPFTQDMRQDNSLWGHLLNFHVIPKLSHELGFSFTTHGEDIGSGRGELQVSCCM